MCLILCGLHDRKINNDEENMAVCSHAVCLSNPNTLDRGIKSPPCNLLEQYIYNLIQNAYPVKEVLSIADIISEEKVE